jgi:hypothetical protein
MTTCPYCLAEIPDEARKCAHCGEWVAPDRGAGPPAGKDCVRLLGEAAKTGVAVYAILSVLGLIFGAVVLFGFFLPAWKRAEQRHDQFQEQFGKDWEKARQRHEEFDRDWEKMRQRHEAGGAGRPGW